MNDKVILHQYLMKNKAVVFYIDFKKLYCSLCNSLLSGYETEEDYGYIGEEARGEKHKSCILILRKIIYLIWKNLDILDKFSKEELYMVLNCVRLARNVKIQGAIDLSQEEKYRKLEENYSNSR